VRVLSILLAMTTVMLAGAALVGAEAPGDKRKPLFDTSMFRPQIVFHEFQSVVASEYVTITGVVFSRSPVDRVTVGDRNAMIRPAEPKDLIRLERVPAGASDAPFRTYFEVPDAGLQRMGANDLDVSAISSDGRVSDMHRVTVIKTATKPSDS